MSNKSNFSVRFLISILLAIILLSSCSNIQETAELPTATPVPPTLTPTITLTPTVTPTPTATPVTIPTLDVQNEEISGQYSEEQLSLIESGTFAETENQLQAWVEYWMQSGNPPFDPESFNLQFKYIFDDTDSTGQSAGVLLENLETGETFYLPIEDGQYMVTPPEVEASEIGEFTIPAGFGPLELSTGEFILAWRDGGWSKVDTRGNIRETLNLEMAQWELTENYKDFIISNSLDATVDLHSINRRMWSLDDCIHDNTEIIGNPHIDLFGSILSYKFDRKNGETSLYILLGVYNGAVKFKVPYVIAYEIPGLPQHFVDVSNLNAEEAQKYADLLDTKISVTNTNGNFDYSEVDDISISSLDSQDKRDECLVGATSFSGADVANGMCVYDPDNALDGQGIINLIKGNLISVKDLSSFDEILQCTDDNMIESTSGYVVYLHITK